MGRRSRPGLGFRDGRDDLVLGPSFLHHPLDERAKVVRVRVRRQGSHWILSRRLQGGGNADLRASEPGTRSPTSMPDRVASTAGLI
jgi:hypothetical protein